MSMGVNTPSKSGGRKRQTPEINVTPLVDVMLVLLVIFMITVQAVKESIPMELPEAQGKPDDPNKTPFEVNVDEGGRVHSGGRTLDMVDVDTELPHILEGHDKEGVTLNAHRKIPFETIVKVIAAIRAAGIESINISVDSGGGGKAGGGGGGGAK